MSPVRTHPYLTMTAVAAALLALVLQALPTADTRTLPPVQGLEEAMEEAHELQAPADAMLARQLFGSDALPTDVFADRAEQAQQLPQVGGRWEFNGPSNLGGRILDVAVDPELEDTIYVAAASGGVWKSSDAGMTYETAWPDDLTQSIGALTIGPDGTLYAGTGETGPGGGSMTYGGTGLYRSTDRGQTWKVIGLEKSSRIGRIVLGPEREDGTYDIFVAASGPLYKPGGQRGLYRSRDGGETWERVLKGDNATTGAVDLAIDPSNPQRVFAAMWDHLRQPDIRRYNGLGSGLYVSNDGGSTFTRTAVGILGPSPALGRLGVAIAATDPKTMYVTASGESGAYAGFYKSVDGGTTWTPIAHPIVAANNMVYGWWFGRVWVDPTNANHVFQAGLGLAESTDGGVNWAMDGGLLGEPHADQHALAWDPKVPNRIYLGNDGGVYRSDDNAKTWKFAEHQPWSQLYGVDISEQDPNRLVAGLQDNGVNRSYKATGDAGPDQWNSYGGGDGERTLINPQNQNIVYGCSQYGECFRSDSGGGSPKDNFTNEVVSSRKNWFTPIEFDPAKPSTIYTGGEIMSRSDDDGRNWKIVSPDLSNGPGRETNPLFKNFGTLTTIAPAPNSSSPTGTIYAGTDDGNLWYTHTGGATWTKATDADLPTAWVTRVEVDRANPKRAYVTYSGFRSGDEAAYILTTTDGGKSWTDITGDLPEMPLNDVNIIGDYIVAAGDLGVFASRNDGESWSRLGSRLPLAPINELRYHAPSKTLFAATFGRGVYRTNIAELLGG